MANWAVGHNMPGYMPESDVDIFRDWIEAKYALLDRLDWAAEAEWQARRLAGDSAIAELGAITQPQGFVCYVGGYAYWIDETYEEPDDDGE